jgi:hypothetical protein
LAPGPLVALNGAELLNVPLNVGSIFFKEWTRLEHALNIAEGAVEIRFALRSARATGLRGDKQPMARPIEFFDLFFLQADMSHSGGQVVAQPKNRFAALLRVNRVRDEKEGRGERYRPCQLRSPCRECG